MKDISQTYRSLLVDVARSTGFSEIRGSETDLQWCLNEAPKLEKLVLGALENSTHVDLDAFPKPLHRLVEGSLVDPLKLRALRQLLLFSYKAAVTHSKLTTDSSIKQFEDTNRAVGAFGNTLSRVSPTLLKRVSQHVQSVLFEFRPRDIVPAHGPGSSTTPKGAVWEKWYDTIEYCYPYSDYFALYQNRDQLRHMDCLTEEHIEAKLIAVPKDSRGPRLICVHPAEAIWIQQGVRVELERAINRPRSSPGIWPHGHIHFDDQSVNGKLALSSSNDRKYATLDMKEASDRLSEVLVQILFGRKYKYFGCCRAQRYTYQPPLSGELVRGDVHCYAPMGNATTFPVQSLVFWAICVASLQNHGFHQPDSVYVFGDDIIVPTECAEVVIDDLESFGLLVNRSKSFWRGSFRESCGVDAFNGVDVTPVRWRCGFDAECLSDIQSSCDLAMRLRIAGYEEAAVTLYDIVRRQAKRFGMYSVALTNNRMHGGIAEFSFRDASVWRDAYWHRDTQQFVSPVMRVQEEAPTGVLYGWNRVLESVCSLERTSHSNVPDRHVSRRVVLNRGWIPVA